MAKDKSVRGKVAHFIRERRKAKGFTQEKLAEMAGLTSGAISQLETGIINYTQPTLEAIAKALGCHPADLLMPISSKQDKIRSEPEILAFLARIDGLNEKDITVAFAVIQNALQVNRGGSERSDSDDPQPASSSLHARVP